MAPGWATAGRELELTQTSRSAVSAVRKARGGCGRIWFMRRENLMEFVRALSAKSKAHPGGL